MLNFKDPGLPHPTPTRSVWLDENPLKTYKASAKLPEFSDIVIIGSGFSGTSVAYHLLVEPKTKLKPNALLNKSNIPSVTLLEAREACGGATGRNGGHIIPDNHRGFLLDSQVYQGRAMDAAATRVFEQLGMNEVVSLVQNQKINCELRTAGNVECYSSTEEYKEALHSVTEAAKWGISPLKIFTKSELQKELGTQEYAGAIKIPSGQLYPARLIWHLLNAAIINGLQLYTYTPVTNVRPATQQEISSLSAKNYSASLNSEKLWCVESQSGERIITRDVVHATNAYAAHLLPQFRSKVFPVRAQIISTSSENTPKLWPFGLSLRDGLEYAMRRDYPNGRLIYGGFRTASDSLEVDNSNDSEINPQLSAALRDSLKSKVFSSMDYNPETYYGVREWTGIMGFSDDDAPYIGKLYDSDSQLVDGQWTLVGLSAHGMPRCFRCGREIARRVSEKYMSAEELSLRKVRSSNDANIMRDSKNMLKAAKFNTLAEKQIHPTTWATNGENDIDDWDYPLPRSFITSPQRFSSTNTQGWDQRTIFPEKKSSL
ncbi:hypothetical protein BB561_001235 [Smittium simulii]|uniref:FAD dependent oxidoreductase domain-containing protein n=2 Tax=Smittium simulii TaxID=133385 RepID=A0A2T9YVI6_9FUNG|nr:hypothetical protein BB561_001235 [Smittium simulii]